MTPCSEYGLPLKYLNLKQKCKSKVWEILWRTKVRVEIDKYATIVSFYLL